MTLLQAMTVAGLLAGTPCEEAIRRELQGWGAREDVVFAGAPDPTGTLGALLPTETLGIWVRLEVDPHGEALVERITAARIESRRFGPDCVAVDIGRRELTIATDGWTDAELAERLRKGDTGVILLWSPHLPLSVDAYDLLLGLTREMGIELVVALHPEADAAYARSVALARGMPSSVLRPLAGIELVFRGMTTHAPSVQAFAGGRFLGPVLPGYRDREGFRLSIERALGRRP
jgi:hypothetical protein